MSGQPIDLPLDGLPAACWGKDQSRLFLDGYPLTDLIWPDRDGKRRKVVPAHGHAMENYGKWLAETPYFPGLFETAHRIIATIPLDLDPEQSGQFLLKKLREIDRLRGEQLGLLEQPVEGQKS